MKLKLQIIAAVVGLLIAVYGVYQFKRWVNYEVGYSSMVTKEVKEQICSMVKPEKHAEVFTNPEACK